MALLTSSCSMHRRSQTAVQPSCHPHAWPMHTLRFSVSLLGSISNTSRHVCNIATPRVPTTPPPTSVPDWQQGKPTEKKPVGVPAPQEKPAKEQQGYAWTKQWYPVAVESALDPAVPHKVTLLGYDLVLWKEPGTGTWSCLDNACPHRAAPLSQGSIEPSTGCLQCSYHGWKFDAGGKCTDIPQSSNPQTMCSIKATKARSHPVQLRQGLLWVWPETGPEAAAEAAATPATVAPELDDPSWSSDYGWIWREVPVSIDYGIENALDSAHAPFAHNGCLGVSANDARKDAALKVTKYDLKWGVEHVCDPPLKAGLLADCRQTHAFEAPGLFHVKNDQGRGLMEGTELKLVVYRTPVRAGVSTAFYNNVRRAITPDVCTIAVWSAGTELKLVVYRTPVRAGVSTAFYNNVRRAITPEGEKKLAELRARFRSTQRFGEGANTLETHMNMLRFFDADLVLVHEQERLVQDKGGWQAAFCMPHHSDAGVLAMRRWWDAAGPVPYKDGHKLGPMLSREKILDHYNSHVLRCPDCQKELKNLRKKQETARIASVVLAASSLALAVAHSIRLLLRSAPAAGITTKAAAMAASTASGPAGNVLQSVTHALSAAATGTGPLWWLLPAAAVAMAVGAGWLYFDKYKGLKAWEQDHVFFRDYDLRYGPNHKPAPLV